MSRYTVKVRTDQGIVAFSAIGATSIDVHLAALEMFGVCGVTVRKA